MTIKELSEFTGKNKSTVGRWVAKCNTQEIYDKLQNATQYSPADFDIDEVEIILSYSSMSKDAVSILMQNARKRNIPEIHDSKKNIDYEALGKVVAIAVTAAMEPIMKLISTNQFKEKPLQIEKVPEKPLRAVFVEKMKEYTRISGKTHREAYHYVYDEIGARYGIRIMARAKNRGCTGVDVLESDNYLSCGISVLLLLIKTIEEGI